MGNLVDFVTDCGVAIITLNDPPVNSYTHEMMSELDACIVDARFNEDVEVLVITGHGDNYFSAGANINMLREVDAGFRYNLFLYASETLARLEHTPKLVIAAINGHATGGGLELALACDIRLARRAAGHLSLPQISLGLLPGAGGSQRLGRMLGKGRAMQLMLEAENVSFEAAFELGILNHVWDAPSNSEFMGMVLEYASRFTYPNASPLVVGQLKCAIQASYELPLEQGIAFERELHQSCPTADIEEGLAAWAEKRRPVFQGK